MPTRTAGQLLSGDYQWTDSVISSVVTLTVLYPPGIVQNLLGFTGSLDSSNSLSVVASGTPPLFYQWMLNGTNLVGATNSDYAITDLTLDTAGSYSVEVTNAYGYTNSSSATVALLPSLVSPSRVPLIFGDKRGIDGGCGWVWHTLLPVVFQRSAHSEPRAAAMRWTASNSPMRDCITWW